MNKRIVLVGNPNCGKTTIFNALTGDNQLVGNWPGVTVEKKSGFYTFADQRFEVTDLPGVYALGIPETIAAKDAQISAHVIAACDMDILINVIDACHLERQLYLTSQLLELGKPMIIALNMLDIASQNGIQIDSQALSKQLNCPVVDLQAHREIGLTGLQEALLVTEASGSASQLLLKRLPQTILDYARVLQQHLGVSSYLVYRWMEQAIPNTPPGHAPIEDLDVLVADARYHMIHEWVGAAQTKSSDAKEHITARLDRWLLHRIWGLPIFFTVMYALFFLAIGVGGALQSGVDIVSKGIFVQLPINLLTYFQAPSWLISIGAKGLGQACNTMLTFLPVLAVMYCLLSFLEASGYMARVGFIVDRLMRSLGLPGQAFVPIIVGFGCNVPAILAARTLQTERDRLLTILMNPYMSCSARLAIYAVFVAVFFPVHGAWVILSLYGVGISMAVLTGWLLRRTRLPSQETPMLLELPAYHLPTWQRLYRETSLRLWYFLKRSSRIIMPVCLMLSIVNTIDIGQQSLLGWIGQWLTPLFAPMGITHDNWPAVVALLTGVLAKEVVIATLSSLYLQLSHTSSLVGGDAFSLWQTLQDASMAIGGKLIALVSPFSALATANQQTLPTLSHFLKMYFGSSIAAYAYLLFILLYIPCVSTMAVIRQEANKQWMWFSVLWSLALAYATAVIYYQVGTWALLHRVNLLYLLGSVGMLIYGIHRYRSFGACRASSHS
jgi:ferrous iron transport protein B